MYSFYTLTCNYRKWSFNHTTIGLSLSFIDILNLDKNHCSWWNRACKFFHQFTYYFIHVVKANISELTDFPSSIKNRAFHHLTEWETFKYRAISLRIISWFILSEEYLLQDFFIQRPCRREVYLNIRPCYPMTAWMVHSKANLINGCSTFVLGNSCPCMAKCIYTIHLLMWNMEIVFRYLDFLLWVTRIDTFQNPSALCLSATVLNVAISFMFKLFLESFWKL